MVHFDNAIRNSANKMPVVRDKHNRALKALQGLFKNIGTRNIQVVRRLVQTQQRTRRHQHFCKRQAPLFPA